MSNQKRFLAVMLVIFAVVSTLTITGMAMLFDGMKKLGNLNLLSATDSVCLTHLTENISRSDLSFREFLLTSYI